MPGEAKSADTPERLLGEEGGRALRNYLDWLVEGGFALGIIELTEPWRRRDLLTWIADRVPGTRSAAMDKAQDRSIVEVIEEACAPPGETRLLVLMRLEEALERGRLYARLNIQRDELVKRFAVPWLILIHPVAALELQMRAPDLVDFAGMWQREEPHEEERIRVAPSLLSVFPAADVGAGSSTGMLGKAREAIALSHYDEANDLLAQYDQQHPNALSEDPERMWLHFRLLLLRGHTDEASAILNQALKLSEDTKSPWRATILIGLGDISARKGDWDGASRWYAEAKTICEAAGDVAWRAVTLNRIAQVHQARGNLDEALRIYQEDVLPTLEKVGDARDRAVTLTNIATILQTRGEVEEALSTYRETAQVYETLDDTRSLAFVQSMIANVLHSRGDRMGALRIYREDVLPALEALGDSDARAGVMGAIADVLRASGELDEALRIYHDEVLPVYEAQGDDQSREIVMSKIIYTMGIQGQLDEAIRIYREKVSPVLSAIGDTHERFKARIMVANTFVRRRAEGDREEALALLSLALLDARTMKLPDAERIQKLINTTERPMA